MRRMIMAALMLAALGACSQPAEKKVMARFVPERADDFVFENDLVCGRIYGKALEGNPTSPGVDIWVKLPGKLVADQWYAAAAKDGGDGYYHHDHGGKDCYKVSVSLGGGASVPYIDGRLCYAPTNYRSYDIVEDGPEKCVFVLHYPEWEVAEGIKVALDKQISVTPGTYFFDVQDSWTFTGTDTLTVAAGINRHINQSTIENEMSGEGIYAIWEHASDTSHEAEDGMLGVAVVMPEADSVAVTEDGSHGLCIKSVTSGQTVRYRFGNCWSKGDIGTCQEWFDTVNAQQNENQ